MLQRSGEFISYLAPADATTRFIALVNASNVGCNYLLQVVWQEQRGVKVDLCICTAQSFTVAMGLLVHRFFIF